MEFSAEAEECLNKAKAVGWDLSLDSIKALLEELDNPQDKCLAVHVTGTNGKGSVCAFLTSILVDAGYKVGRYCSPAVESELERYTINNGWITEEDYKKTFEVIAKAAKIVEAKGFRHPSVFELETALAFLYFSLCNCQIIIVEVGMGGLLDATNVFKEPALCVFTSIGLDHTQWLGKNIEEITKTKGGIIKDNAFVVSAPQVKESEEVLRDLAKAHGCEISFSSPVMDIKPSLPGDFQQINAGLAKECAYALRLRGLKITDKNIEFGLKNTKWPFRFETIYEMPLIILDGAHNPPAIAQLKKALLSNFDNKKLTFIVSVLADKDYHTMFSDIFPLADKVVVVQSDSLRALESKELLKEADSILDASNTTYLANDFKDAALKSLEFENDAIICFGTFTFLNQMKICFKEILF